MKVLELRCVINLLMTIVERSYVDLSFNQQLNLELITCKSILLSCYPLILSLIQKKTPCLMNLCHLLISKQQSHVETRNVQLIQFLKVPNQRCGKCWRKMSKKNIMTIHSTIILILNSSSLIRGSTDIPPDLRKERQMKLKLLQRLQILSISEMKIRLIQSL